MTTDPRERIAARIKASRRIAVTSHLRPDGDSLCTALALARACEMLGKEAAIINRDETPVPFTSFPETHRIRIGQIDASEFDTVVLLECADVSRSGQEGLQGAYKINIDHHYSNTPYADINWIDPEAPAVGEMAFELCPFLGVTPTPEIAELLYCAIASDTGSFQFSNTTARALGASTEPVRPLGRVLSTLTMNERGNLACISMFRGDVESLNMSAVDTEDMTTLARSIRGVEMVLFFKEMSPETFRVSLRSKGRANAARVAEHFGGGGHVHASGFTVYGPYERLIAEIPRAVEALLSDMSDKDGPASG